MKHIKIGLLVFVLGVIVTVLLSNVFINEFENILLFSILISVLYTAAVIGTSVSLILDKIKNNK